MSRAVAESFTEKQPGYSFKQATFAPVNSNNPANTPEECIIDYFAENSDQKLQKGIMEKKGENFLYVVKMIEMLRKKKAYK